MKADFHKSFIKNFRLLPDSVQQEFYTRLKIFYQNPYATKLSNHPLKGKRLGYRSINISGDIRAIYKLISDDKAFFVEIGSHSQLYR